MIYEEYMGSLSSSWKNEISKVSTFSGVNFSVCRKQNWIINLQTSAHLLHLSLCSSDIQSLESLRNLFPTDTTLRFQRNYVQSLRLAFFFSFNRVAVTLQADSLVLFSGLDWYCYEIWKSQSLSIFQVSAICGALRDLVLFVQFKKREKN